MKALIAAILCCATPLFAQDLPRDNAGVWHGVGVQVDAQDWAMELTLGDEAPKVNYPSLKCGGEWEYLKVNEAQILAIERITYGQRECLDGGLVRLEEHDDDMLIYRWFDKAGTAIAAAVLIHGEMRDDTYGALLRLTLEAVGMAFITGPEGTVIDLKENKI